MTELSKRHALFFFYRGTVYLNAMALGMMAAAAAYQVAIAIADPVGAVDQLQMALAWAFLGSINVTLFFFLKTWRPN